MQAQELASVPTPLREAAPAGEDGAAGRRSPGHAPRRLPDAALLADLVERHASARRALPYVVALLAKVAARHRRRNPKLAALCDVGQELAEALEVHGEAEEREVFPALARDAPAHDEVARQLDRVRRHHRELELQLSRVRWLADDFAVPAWGGRSYQDLMEELEALEADVLEHVHLEAFLLLPRLSARAAGAS